ncbi:NUDIX hydrolase [Oxalobacteraceae bacterium A2-2]
MADACSRAWPVSLPDGHRQFLLHLLQCLAADERIVGVAAAGSFLSDRMDGYSDLDLVLAIAPSAVLSAGDRRAIAASAGALLGAFSGEHVGEPRLLICLYQQPLLHVDLKFVTPDEVAQGGAAVLWWREGAAAPLPGQAPSAVAGPDLDWIEARFWTWVHYGAARIGRGELFETLDFLSFLRTTVLGPLALSLHGAPPHGVRRVETVLPPSWLEQLKSTVVSCDAPDCIRGLRAAAALYRALRAALRGPAYGTPQAEQAALAYLYDIEQQLALRRRPAARLLVLDPAGRVLLFRFAHPGGIPATSDYWATPGGGLDEGETFADAARRELYEETGIVAPITELAGIEREFVMQMLDGEMVLAQERFFAVRVDSQVLSTEHWTDLEKQIMTEHRWWSMDELRDTTELVFPPNLAALCAMVAP